MRACVYQKSQQGAQKIIYQNFQFFQQSKSCFFLYLYEEKRILTNYLLSPCHDILIQFCRYFVYFSYNILQLYNPAVL